MMTIEKEVNSSRYHKPIDFIPKCTKDAGCIEKGAFSLDFSLDIDVKLGCFSFNFRRHHDRDGFVNTLII